MMHSEAARQTATLRISRTSKRQEMAYLTRVLSWNPDTRTLFQHEVVLRENNFEVISVSTPLDARFEIEKGNATIFMASYVAPVAIYRDLADLFRRKRPEGIVVFVTQGPGEPIPNADIVLSEQDEARALVESLRARQGRRPT
jgi:hypothetical protein